MANRTIARAVRVALMTASAASLVGVGLFSPKLAAQEVVDEIVVTGSRIAKRDAIAESPIFTVEQESMRQSGHVTVDHYLNTLPQIVPNISSQSNNPSSGGRAFVSLRGLGPQRNLVLIDGRRMIGQEEGGTLVDVNTIPSALIDRAEIISGGAAAVYGADALAGVVNFIMKKSFDGFALDSQYRLTDAGDGEEISSDLTFGGDFAGGRGSSVFNLNWFKRQAMYKDARRFTAQAVNSTGIFPNGSWSTGTNTPDPAAVAAMFSEPCAVSGGTRGFGFNPDGSLFCTGLENNSGFNMVNYQGPPEHVALNFAPDSFSYNFEPDNILVLPLERWSIYNYTELDLHPNFKPYAQAMFTNYNASQELAASPVGGLLVPVTNPFIPAGLAALLATRPNPTADFSLSKRFNALGGRVGYNDHDVWQLTTGATGDIAGSWSYDAYASWGRSVRNEVQSGNVRLPPLEELLQAADGGASICEGGLNLFGAAPISQACQDRISLQAKNLTVVEQGIMEAVATGNVAELPAGSLQGAVGASYRHLSFDFLPDSGLQPGLVVGFNEQLPVSGRLWYTDLFAELSVPLLADLPTIQSLSATLGFRTTDNNVFGSDESYKVTFDWSVSDALRFRGGFQHAIRSPNIDELFAPQLNNFPNVSDQDPCNFDSSFRTGPNAAQVQALCAAQSVVAGDASFTQPFGQAVAIVGGNPDLEPEQADSWSAGLVFSPQFGHPLLERFGLSLDYYSIEIDDLIASVNAITIISRCYNAEGANPNYELDNRWCQLFNRDQTDGRIIDLQQFQLNQSTWKVSGIDTTLNWGFGLGPGDLDFSALVAWLDKFEIQTTSVDAANDFAGTIGNITGTARPEWRGTLTTSYTLGDWQVQAITRYISSMMHSALVTNPNANASGTDATWYLDLAGRYDLTANLTIRAGINNVANQKPRLYAPSVQSGTDPSLFDVLGRRYFVGFNWRM